MSRNPTPLIEKRRQGILDAFLKLFCTRRFNEIHIKMISEETSFTRATIYNYFKNIDEIFVSAYQKEYIAWAEDLGLILSGYQQLTHEELARLIAESLSHRELMLRFSLENFREREANCRREFIFDHKAAFGRVIDLMHDILIRYCPEKSEEDVLRCLYIFFPFMHGMYRYIDLTPRVREARDAVNIRLKDSNVRDLAYSALLQILK